jgi:transposase InsO family protein
LPVSLQPFVGTFLGKLSSRPLRRSDGSILGRGFRQKLCARTADHCQIKSERIQLMAKIRRQPHHPVLLHSDQASQYGSNVCIASMTANGLIPSMSRRLNCHDNAVVGSFFATFKKACYTWKDIRHDGGKPKQKFLMLSRCFTIQSKGIRTTADYRPSNMKTLVSKGFKVSSNVWEVHKCF